MLYFRMQMVGETMAALDARILLAAGLSALLLLASPAASAQKSAAEPYDFKGIKLGITVEEFKQTPYPEAADHGVAFPVCTGATDRFGDILDVAVYGDEKDVGIVKCRYKGDGVGAGYFSIANSGYASYDYELKFVPDSQGGPPRLYEIRLPTASGADPAVARALTEKFGKPVTRQDAVQNRMGATFQRFTRVWTNGSSSVTTISPYGNLDDMEIVYRHTQLANVAKDLLGAKAAAKGSGM